jgi:hypothetical protein
MNQQQSWASLVRQVLYLMLWVMRRLLRVLFRRPVIDVLLLLLALYLIAGFISNVLRPQPEPVLYEPPFVFEGR